MFYVGTFFIFNEHLLILENLDLYPKMSNRFFFTVLFSWETISWSEKEITMAKIVPNEIEDILFFPLKSEIP